MFIFLSGFARKEKIQIYTLTLIFFILIFKHSLCLYSIIGRKVINGFFSHTKKNQIKLIQLSAVFATPPPPPLLPKQRKPYI